MRKKLSIQAEMDASESYRTGPRFKINYYLYFMGTEERVNNCVVMLTTKLKN